MIEFTDCLYRVFNYDYDRNFLFTDISEISFADLGINQFVALLTGSTEICFPAHTKLKDYCHNMGTEILLLFSLSAFR